MPFINCPDCGQEISSFAKTCPNCGRSFAEYEIPAQVRDAAKSERLRLLARFGGLTLGGLVVLAALAFLVDKCA